MQNKEQVIAIYGISPATQEFLQQQNSEFNVIGLLDGYCQGGELYGKPIISLEEAILSGVEAIIIVARPSSRRIIVNRIRKICVANGVNLYDVHGNNLLESEKRGFVISGENGISKARLLEQLDKSEVVSFDIFDTLLMRKVLYPSDVFELLESELVAKHGQGFDFSKERQEAERKLSRTGVPTIGDIYKELKTNLDLSEKELKEVQELEWQIEQKVLVPRREMCQILRYALEKQKQVYLVSDMYYSEKQLKTLLNQFGIEGYQKILVSCEYGTTKEQRLFRILKEVTQADRYVHIGDNYVADVKSAEKNEITGIWVKSGLELFEKAGGAWLFEETDTLSDKIKQGLFVAELFNNPFALEGGQLSIKKPENLGYLLVAPLLTDFVLWLDKKIVNMQSKTVLFCARDGYLIQQLYDILQSRKTQTEEKVQSIYFLTSRTSAVSAGIIQRQDIAPVAGHDFNGDLKKLLQTRFLLPEDEIDKMAEGALDAPGALGRYEEAILRRSKVLRENYWNYIRSLKIPQENVAFFDFVSSGTCQLYLEKIIQQKMKGCYFMHVDADNPEKKQLEIDSFYNAKERDSSKVYEDYFILENVVTAPIPSVKCFNESGNPQYMEEKRSKEEIEFITDVQKGVIEYFEQYLDLLPESAGKADKRCSEQIWNLIHEISVENEVFHQLVWEDSFYSRTLLLKELM